MPRLAVEAYKDPLDLLVPQELQALPVPSDPLDLVRASPAQQELRVLPGPLEPQALLERPAPLALQAQQVLTLAGQSFLMHLEP
ncbi:hypothetical protein PAEN110709_27260 [Paenibacillus endophyticus]